jgi:hypothetical protein
MIIPFNPLTELVTPARINFIVRKTKYPPAHAAAMGKPTSEINLKIEPIST